MKKEEEETTFAPLFEDPSLRAKLDSLLSESGIASKTRKKLTSQIMSVVRKHIITNLYLG